MFIRRTTIKSRRTGAPYYSYRLVESIREGARVRQRTLLSLGRHFEVPRAQWPALVQRIEALLSGQGQLFATQLDARWEQSAQHYAAQVIRARAGSGEGSGAAHRRITASMSVLSRSCARAAWRSSMWPWRHCAKSVWIRS